MNWPLPLNLAELAAREPEAPSFIVDGWLPVGYASLLAGHGGAGKSTVALTLAVCISAGIPFFGVEVSRRRVMYLSGEDRESVLHWRLDRICTHLGVELEDLGGWLAVLDLVGHDAVLWARDYTGSTITDAYGYLYDRVYATGAEVLIVDGSADTFGGREVDRGDVKRYINALVALMPRTSGAVLVVAHVAKPNANSHTAEGYSGSTAWHNSVRARWYLYPEQRELDGANEKTGDLLLELQKSNLGRADQHMRFRWDEDAHLFVGQLITPRTGLDRQHRDQRERDAILDAFKACTDYVPAATTGRRTAFHVLSARPEFPDSLAAGGKPERARFWRHLEALRRMQLIREASIRRANRHETATLELANHADNGGCANAPNE